MTLSVLDDGVILGGYCPGTVRPSWNPRRITSLVVVYRLVPIGSVAMPLWWGRHQSGTHLDSLPRMSHRSKSFAIRSQLAWVPLAALSLYQSTMSTVLAPENLWSSPHALRPPTQPR
jgi:hypothetical protein